MTSIPDPHGQAALMLCESLLLLLIAEGVIHKQQAIDAVEGVIEVSQEIAAAAQSTVVSIASINLLREIGRSLAAAVSPDKAAAP